MYIANSRATAKLFFFFFFNKKCSCCVAQGHRCVWGMGVPGGDRKEGPI